MGCARATRVRSFRAIIQTAGGRFRTEPSPRGAPLREVPPAGDTTGREATDGRRRRRAAAFASQSAFAGGVENALAYSAVVEVALAVFAASRSRWRALVGGVLRTRLRALVAVVEIAFVRSPGVEIAMACAFPPELSIQVRYGRGESRR